MTRRRGYSREDVSVHTIGYGGRVLPAVNVKVYTSVTAQTVANVAREHGAEGLTLEWVEEQLERDAEGYWFADACQWESEYLISYACDDDDAIFADYRVTAWHEGRQGGWIVVDGLPDLSEWDAVLLAKWRKFERIARQIADGIPHQMVSLLVLNVWEPERARMAEQLAEDSSAAASEGVPLPAVG